jgi:RNA polymerase sigma factor (sigma-70 family)
MTADPPFEDLMGRVRRGDADAAGELVQRYEPAIRAAVRGRMGDTRLNALFDSADVCQMVLASFFARVAVGEYRLDTPDDLVALLVVMARNKLLKQVSRHRARGRDYRRSVDSAEADLPPTAPDPARQAAAADLLTEVFRRLSADERRLVELRQQGWEWAAIAEAVGGTPEGVRKQHARAVARVAAELDDA